MLFESICGYTVKVDTSQPQVIRYIVLTPCCQAVVIDDHLCAGCLKPAPVHCESQGWGALFAAAKAHKCPCPSECADFAMFRLSKEMYAGAHS